jgi:hypothetical protein
MNSVLDGLRERRLEKVRHPVGNVREKRTEIVGCRFEGFGRRRERYIELSVVIVEVVIVSARECWISSRRLICVWWRLW